MKNTFTTKEVAERLGVEPHVIYYAIKALKLDPALDRDEFGNRVYTFSDFVKLQRAIQLKEKHGLNYAAIRMIFEEEERQTAAAVEQAKQEAKQEVRNDLVIQDENIKKFLATMEGTITKTVMATVSAYMDKLEEKLDQVIEENQKLQQRLEEQQKRHFEQIDQQLRKLIREKERKKSWLDRLLGR